MVTLRRGAVMLVAIAASSWLCTLETRKLIACAGEVSTISDRVEWSRAAKHQRIQSIAVCNRDRAPSVCDFTRGLLNHADISGPTLRRLGVRSPDVKWGFFDTVVLWGLAHVPGFSSAVMSHAAGSMENICRRLSEIQ